MYSMSYHNLGLEAYIFPREGKWSEFQYQEILESCKKVPSLEKAFPSGSSEGGFEFPITDEVRVFQEKEDITIKLGGDIRTYFPSTYYFKASASKIQCLKLFPKYGVAFRQMIEILRLFESHGHTILATEGFDYITESLEKPRKLFQYVSVKEARERGYPLLLQP